MENSNTTSDLESSGSVSGCDEWLDIIFLVLDGLLCGLIIFGNGLTCFIFLNKAHFRSCFMNTFLVSLALADILMALLVMPGEVIFCTSCSQSISKHCWLIGSVKYVVFPSTKLNLLAITFDRYTAVMSPLKYNSKINSKKVFSILTVVWTIPMILTISRLAWWIKLPKNRAFYVDRVFNSCLIFSLVILPDTILTVANLRIMLEIRKQRCRVRTTNDASVTETRSSCKTENNEKPQENEPDGEKGNDGLCPCGVDLCGVLVTEGVL